MKINIKFIVLLLVASFISCEEDGYAEYDAGDTNTEQFHGEWFIATYNPNGEVVSDYHHWYTYNTSQNNDSIWIDDYNAAGNFGFKTKVFTTASNMTFAGGQGGTFVNDTIFATISSGRIFENQGRAASSGTVVDSIYFEVEYSSEPGVIYTFGGHERTGFDEDDNPHL